MSKKIKKVDVFSADRSLQERVADFVTCVTMGITLRTRYGKKISAYETVIEDKKRPDKVWINDEAKAEAIAKAEKDLEDCKAEFRDLLDKQAKFVYTEADNALFKAYQGASCDMHLQLALIEWFKVYRVNVQDTDLMNNIIDALGGKRSNSARVKVNTGVMNGKRTKSDILKVLYGEVADYWISKGLTIPMQFDDDVKMAYAPKKKSAK